MEVLCSSENVSNDCHVTSHHVTLGTELNRIEQDLTGQKKETNL